MRDSTISPIPSGAGRYYDWRWPDYNVLTTTANMRQRVEGGTSRQVMTSSGNGLSMATIEGTDVQQLPSSLTTGCFQGAPPVHVRTTKSAIVIDDLAVVRLFATMCGTGITIAATTDFGLQVIQPPDGTTRGIYLNTTFGFGFMFLDAATAQITVRGNNGLKTFNFAVDTTHLHTYEMRITSATPLTDASIEWRLDNVRIANVPATMTSWATGTDLPPSITSGFPKQGFLPQLVNNQRVVDTLRVFEYRQIAAPTIQDCL